MNRSLIILLGALALAATVFAGSYFAAQRVTVTCCARPADGLSWLRDEFHLNDAEMARIHDLHEGYQPKCAEMCAKIAAKKGELASVLGSSTNLTPEARTKLNEITELRAQCQVQMLQYVAAVSQAMPPEQGQRYFAEMKQLTLGTNEFMESRMAGPGDPSHEPQH